MKQDRASRTAEYAASFRALESVRRPADARLFEDRFAVLFLTTGLRWIIRLAALPLVGAAVPRYVDFRWPGAMTSGIARTRLIDDLLLAALRDGIRQVLILGAGFDCRARRLPELASCRVVEIDHPATQALKRERLTRLSDPRSDPVHYIAADLTRQDLRSVLEAVNLEREQRSLVLWEGVTHYLGADAVDSTLRTLSTVIARGSRLIFTYLHGGLLDGSVQFDRERVSRERVADDGEPWIWGIDPARLSAFLAERGFLLLQDQNADEYRARYWGERGQRMRGFAFYRVALAQVG